MQYDKSAPCSQDPKNALLVASLILGRSGFRVEATGDGGIEIRSPGLKLSDMDPLRGISYLRIHIENETIRLEAELGARIGIQVCIYFAFLVLGVIFFGAAILTHDAVAWTFGIILSSSFLFVLLFFYSLKNNTIEALDSILRKMQTDRFDQSHSSEVEIQKSCRIENTSSRVAPLEEKLGTQGESETELPEETVSLCVPNGCNRSIREPSSHHPSRIQETPAPRPVLFDPDPLIEPWKPSLHPGTPMFVETEIPYTRDPRVALQMARTILTHADFRIESFDDKGLEASSPELLFHKKHPNAQDGISRLRIQIANETIHFHVELEHAVRRRRQTRILSSLGFLFLGTVALICILTGNHWGALLPLWPGLFLFLNIRIQDRYALQSTHKFINTLSQNMRFGGDVSS